MWINSIELEPKKDNLKISTTEVIGFNAEKILYFSGIILRGYTIGVANIHNWTAKDITKVKSLYFVVKADIKIPNPKPKRAIWKITNGRKKIKKFIDVSMPDK